MGAEFVARACSANPLLGEHASRCLSSVQSFELGCRTWRQLQAAGTVESGRCASRAAERRHRGTVHSRTQSISESCMGQSRRLRFVWGISSSSVFLCIEFDSNMVLEYYSKMQQMKRTPDEGNEVVCAWQGQSSSSSIIILPMRSAALQSFSQPFHPDLSQWSPHHSRFKSLFVYHPLNVRNSDTWYDCIDIHPPDAHRCLSACHAASSTAAVLWCMVEAWPSCHCELLRTFRYTDSNYCYILLRPLYRQC